MDALATGSGDALEEDTLQGEELEAVAEVVSAVLPLHLISVTAVVNLVITLRTVTFTRTSVTTVGEVATSPKTVLSLSAQEKNAVTLVADRAIWLMIVTIRKSRSATLVVSMVTFRKTAPKASATGVARRAIWPSTVPRQWRSTAIAVESQGI